MLRFFCLCFYLCLGSGNYQPTWESLDSRPLPEWYDKAKVGIFVHWGVYSVPAFGSELFWQYWKQGNRNIVEFMRRTQRPGFSYQEFAKSLTAEFYSPSKWADIFNASGAKYVVLSSKHFEGFTLWPSNYSWNWNAEDVGPRRDLLGLLATAIRRRTKLVFGVSYTLLEWFNPMYKWDKESGFRDNTFAKTKAIPELKQLITKYKPEIIWSGGDFEAPDTYWGSKEFLAWLYNESPVKDTVVVNDNWGSLTSCKHGGVYTCLDYYFKRVYETHKWESKKKLEKTSWGYVRNAQITDYMTPEEVITDLVKTVSTGGNLLLNIAPTADGRITPIFEERLKQLGSWLTVNGESIYNTNPWTYRPDRMAKFVWYTKNLETLYAIALKWPKENTLVLGTAKLHDGVSVSMLGLSKPLTFNTFDNTSVISFPDLSPNDIPSQWAWVLKFSFYFSVK